MCQKQIPSELVESFINGTKHPVSSLMEYCSIVKKNISFHEVAVKKPSFLAMFANMCKVDGIEYPQGTGKTKKDAKTSAAKNAFSIILGLDFGSDVEENDVVYDSTGRKLVLSSTKVNHEPKRSTECNNCENYVSDLHEFCATNRISFTIQVSDTGGPNCFLGTVEIQGSKMIQAYANDKEECKRKVAEKALEFLKGYKIGSKDSHKSQIDLNKLSTPDQIGTISYLKLVEVLKQCPDLSFIENKLAAFILKRSEDDVGEVVALGTGRCCLSTENVAVDGRVLLDSSSLTVARRSLLKYLHKEFKDYWEGKKETSIFTKMASSNIVMLKDNISLHLFLSHPPEGDCLQHISKPSAPLSADQVELTKLGAHFPFFKEKSHGHLCTKDEDGIINIVKDADIKNQTMQAFRGVNTKAADILIMSASDKLLCWNILGLQGAAYSHFMAPIYMSSITLGCEEHGFDHGHLSRAVCCRVYDILNESLPTPYHIKHPLLNRVTSSLNDIYSGGKHVTSLSLNWSLADEKIEIVDGITGKTTPMSPFKSGKAMASRLCKASFLFRFKDMAKCSNVKSLFNISTYGDAKKASKEYQQAKDAFHSHCKVAGIGTWMRKPGEIEQFSN